MSKSAIGRMWVMVVMVLGMVALAAPAAWAAEFTVTNTNDSGAGSLRQAITEANSTPDEDTITFAPGVESTSSDGAIGLKSALPQLSDMRIEGPGAHRLTVRPYRDRGEDFHNQFRIFTVGAGATVSIDGLTISEGGMTGIDGGAILNPATATLTITNSAVSANRVHEGTGGSGTGGGIFNEGTLTVEDSAVCNNDAWGGGGIYNAVGGALTVADSTVCDNTASSAGGGIVNEGTLTVDNSTYSDNRAISSTASTGTGGAIFNSGSLAITNGTISRNFAFEGGGGIHNMGDADIKSTTIADNTIQTDIGGGISNSGGLTRRRAETF